MTKQTQDAFDTARDVYYALLDNAAYRAEVTAIEAARVVYYAAMDDLNAAMDDLNAAARADAADRDEMANKNL